MAKKIWFSDLAKTAGIRDRTLRNWWQMFCRAEGLTLAPRQATDWQRRRFFRWLADQAAHDQAAHDQALTAHTREAARLRQQHDACGRAVAMLERLVQMYGLEAVTSEVFTPLCLKHGARCSVRRHPAAARP